MTWVNQQTAQREQRRHGGVIVELNPIYHDYFPRFMVVDPRNQASMRNSSVALYGEEPTGDPLSVFSRSTNGIDGRPCRHPVMLTGLTGKSATRHCFTYQCPHLTWHYFDINLFPHAILKAEDSAGMFDEIIKECFPGSDPLQTCVSAATMEHLPTFRFYVVALPGQQVEADDTFVDSQDRLGLVRFNLVPSPFPLPVPNSSLSEPVIAYYELPDTFVFGHHPTVPLTVLARFLLVANVEPMVDPHQALRAKRYGRETPDVTDKLQRGFQFYEHVAEHMTNETPLRTLYFNLRVPESVLMSGVTNNSRDGAMVAAAWWFGVEDKIPYFVNILLDYIQRGAAMFNTNPVHGTNVDVSRDPRHQRTERGGAVLPCVLNGSLYDIKQPRLDLRITTGDGYSIVDVLNVHWCPVAQYLRKRPCPYHEDVTTQFMITEKNATFVCFHPECQQFLRTNYPFLAGMIGYSMPLPIPMLKLIKHRIWSDHGAGFANRTVDISWKWDLRQYGELVEKALREQPPEQRRPGRPRKAVEAEDEQAQTSSSGAPPVGSKRRREVVADLPPDAKV